MARNYCPEVNLQITWHVKVHRLERITVLEDEAEAELREAP